MSIQDTIRKGLTRKLITQLHLGRAIKLPSFTKEKIFRSLNHDPLDIFFPYQHIGMDSHPWFTRFYQTPPLNYCNFKKAKAYHWISFPSVLDKKPFIVEPNDHPLAAVGAIPSFPIEPKDILKHKDEAIDLVYKNDKCKRILVESTGQWSLYERYCPDILDKCEIVRLGTIPKDITFNKIHTNESKISFLCLASDFLRKGVDLLLDAWFEFPDRYKHELVLACPMLPEKYMQRAQAENVTLILKAPLTVAEKDNLHRQADVAIGPLHVDGGSNLFESFEYGLPIITMRCQRSQDQVMNNNGIVVDVPFYFYDEGYGVEWPTWDSFFRKLEDAKAHGEFDETKAGFVKAFQLFSDHPEKIQEMGKGSYDLACNEYSLKRRNDQLLKIYREDLVC